MWKTKLNDLRDRRAIQYDVIGSLFAMLPFKLFYVATNTLFSVSMNKRFRQIKSSRLPSQIELAEKSRGDSQIKSKNLRTVYAHLDIHC